MAEGFAKEYDADLRNFVEQLLTFDTTGGKEAPAQAWIRKRLERWGFDTYEWTADKEKLGTHPSFPDDLSELNISNRPSVAGVLEFGNPDAGPTLVLNGHVDVVPVNREAWTTDPFEPVWKGDELTARGAADMKVGLSVCLFVARYLAGLDETRLNGRLVVESVAGEEEGGIGAASAALTNPYPFERDAAVITEPTELGVITAVEGTAMKELSIQGQSAHAARPWRGESVLPHFEQIRAAFKELECERNKRITHPLYDFPTPWPVNCGVIKAGEWASSVPRNLRSEWRIGVAPGESVSEVEQEFERKLAKVTKNNEWLSDTPPEFERFSVQFEPAEIDVDEVVVRKLQAAMAANALDDIEPKGATYGADSRHYITAGIPTVLFGPGSIDQAHFANETIRWSEVLTAGTVLVEFIKRFCS